jgi:hypothetical protein
VVALVSGLAIVLTQRWHGRYTFDLQSGVQRAHTRPTPRVGGVAIFNAAYVVTVTSTGNDSTRTYTITGTNAAGNALSETITGPNATTVSTTGNFLTVTGVSVVGGGTVGTVRVGFGSSGVTAPLPLDIHGRPDVSLQVTVTGTVTWTVQQSLDNPFTINMPTYLNHPDPNMVLQTVNRQGNYAYVPASVRLRVTSGTGRATLTIIQSGDNRA